MNLKPMRRIIILIVLGLTGCGTGLWTFAAAADGSAGTNVFSSLFGIQPSQDDRPGQIDFLGSTTAALFTKEVRESLNEVFERSYTSQAGGKLPLGFIQASPPPQPWWGSMWTRDTGAFLREMVAWGYYTQACQTAACLMDLAGTNQDGYVAFPRYFSGRNPKALAAHETGTELDGHAAIIIGMVSLWQRLPPTNSFRARLYDFLHCPASPVRYLHHELESHPLIAGTGEFGEGGPKGLCDNVVQNNLGALALLAAADMEAAAGDNATARQWRKDAANLFRAIGQCLVDPNGAWIWCIDPKTLKPDPAVLQRPINVGFGGLNGVLCMTADVGGFDPAYWPWPGTLAHGVKTFDQLYAFPLRKEQFDKYGMWTQFNLIHHGLLSSPSYGQGYAIQTMLLLDKLDMAGRALDYLTDYTYRAPGITFEHGRLSPYYFYERLYSPDESSKDDLATGCGPLNLVNVAEPLKVARLILGVDDTSSAAVRIIPRLPTGWTGYEARDWPIRTRQGVSRVDLGCNRTRDSVTFHLNVKSGPPLPELLLRLSATGQPAWQSQTNVSNIFLYVKNNQ